ncbi:MAG: hypothetical protein FP825_06420 [Hyphomonas sp.]|jgi:hypothetical protein|uniref:hypothetical protein n=1 Tax=Hyphomonas sp. TaxID=87 RepID=UPI001800D105|nr:hypothetical protein [Hyphomonas sp.]MBA3068099.1 hypothetical protein [Hyphomonas sp.]MBU3919348.1 hypothetical protein [Alphaproteobacteria bacterium]MBU4061440.1 hypothetical protein [Alphaproteobacteria bacterium]MBU4162694.1 hypothetical protein [Alphaproteobacteria bacterium]
MRDLRSDAKFPLFDAFTPLPVARQSTMLRYMADSMRMGGVWLRRFAGLLRHGCALGEAETACHSTEFDRWSENGDAASCRQP